MIDFRRLLGARIWCMVIASGYFGMFGLAALLVLKFTRSLYSEFEVLRSQLFNFLFQVLDCLLQTVVVFIFWPRTRLVACLVILSAFFAPASHLGSSVAACEVDTRHHFLQFVYSPLEVVFFVNQILVLLLQPPVFNFLVIWRGTARLAVQCIRFSVQIDLDSSASTRRKLTGSIHYFSFKFW